MTTCAFVVERKGVVLLMNNNLYTSILLVGKNHKGDIDASFVTYSDYGGYNWLADVDINKLKLNSFPSILKFLKHHSYNLELKYLRDEMVSAEIVSMQRDGGYKEPFQRFVEYSYSGYGCLKRLENDLSVQLQSENHMDDDFEKNCHKRILNKRMCIN